MISKLALAAIAAAVSAEDIDAIYPHQLYRRDGGSHSHSSSSSSYGAPEPSYAAPEPSYSAPAPSYGAPEPAYSAPAPSYGAPEPSYGAPEPSYGAPEPSYSSPSYGYEEASGGLDLTSILIPILALLGLSLLFPTFVTVNGTRKKRDVMGEDDESASNMIERVQNIYMSVLESEECIERIYCEVGGLTEDFGYSKKITKSLEMFAPKKYTQMMKTFNHGKDCKKNHKCGYF